MMQPIKLQIIFSYIWVITKGIIHSFLFLFSSPSANLSSKFSHVVSCSSLITICCCLLRKGFSSCHMPLSFPWSAHRSAGCVLLSCVCETCSQTQHWRAAPGICPLCHCTCDRDVDDRSIPPSPTRPSHVQVFTGIGRFRGRAREMQCFSFNRRDCIAPHSLMFFPFSHKMNWIGLATYYFLHFKQRHCWWMRTIWNVVLKLCSVDMLLTWQNANWQAVVMLWHHTHSIAHKPSYVKSKWSSLSTSSSC